MEDIERLIDKFMDIEDGLFIHYSEIPSQFADDLAMIDEMTADFVDDEED